MTHLIQCGILVLGVEQLEFLRVGQPMRLVDLLLCLDELRLKRGDVDGGKLRTLVRQTRRRMQ